MTRMITLAVAVALTLSLAASAQADLTGYWRSVHTTCDVSAPGASAATLAEVKRDEESAYWLILLLQPNDGEVLGLTSLHDYDHSSRSDSPFGHAQAWMRADLSPAGDEFGWSWDGEDGSGHVEAELLSSYHLRLTYRSQFTYRRYSVTADCFRHYVHAPPPPSLHELPVAYVEIESPVDNQPQPRDTDHDACCGALAQAQARVAQLEAILADLEERDTVHLDDVARDDVIEVDHPQVLGTDSQYLMQALAQAEARVAHLEAEVANLHAYQAQLEAQLAGQGHASAELEAMRAQLQAQQAHRAQLEAQLIASQQALAACQTELAAASHELFACRGF